MELKEILTISGKSGLFKILSPSRVGFVVEKIGEENSKLVTTPDHKVSLLSDISIYTTNNDGSILLDEVFQTMFKEFESDLGVTPGSDPDELKAFIKFIIPEYDPDRVYVSDIKKLVMWYEVLVKNFPEFFKPKPAPSKSPQAKPKKSD